MCKKTLKDLFIGFAEKYKAKDKSIDYKDERCDDQYIGILSVDVNRSMEGRVVWITELENIKNRVDSNVIAKETGIPTIAIILESPHKKEYSSSIPMPAMGSTGDNVINHFPELLLKYILQKPISKGANTRACRDIENGEYRVCLINAVQYQCSLGLAATESPKDIIFEECWKLQEYKDDFVERVKDIDPAIIINFCTKGDKHVFNQQVQEIINTFFPTKNRLKGYHPSSSYFFIGFKKVDD